MVYKGKIIKYVPNGHRYQIHKRLSAKESKLVEEKIKQLAAFEKAFSELDKQEQENSDSLTASIEILIRRAELTEQSQKIQSELEEMMRSTLRSCFNLTIAEINKMDTNERQTIFLMLAQECKEKL